MAIRGNLDEASLADVVQLLALGRKTGCLSVADRSNFGRIYFDKGQICYASIVNRRDRLGDTLEKNGVITRSQLEAALALQGRRREARVGELLVELGALTADQLHRAIRVQIEEAVYFLFTWTQGTFNFETDVAPDDRDLVVAITPESVLLEGARRVDEWHVIEKKIPSLDVVFDVDKARLTASNPDLTPEQQTVLRFIDGRRSVHALVDASGLGEFDVGKALYGLVSAGFVRRADATPRSMARSGELRLNERQNLGVAFYKTGMLDEALRELQLVVAAQPENQVAAFYLGLTLLRQGDWSEAAATLQRVAKAGASYAVFHNLAFALERTQRLDEAREAIDEAVRRGGEGDARVLLTSAVVRLLSGKPEDAEAILQRLKPASPNAPSAVWYHYAGLCAAVRGDEKRAVSLLSEGVAAHPRNAQLGNSLAAIREHRGQFAKQVAERSKTA